MIWELENEGKNISEFFKRFLPGGFTIDNFPLILKLEQAKKDGIIRDIKTRILVLNIIGMCIYPFIAKNVIKHIWQDFDLCDESFISDRKTEIYNLVWNGIKRS